MKTYYPINFFEKKTPKQQQSNHYSSTTTTYQLDQIPKRIFHSTQTLYKCKIKLNEQFSILLLVPYYMSIESVNLTKTLLPVSIIWKCLPSIFVYCLLVIADSIFIYINVVFWLSIPKSIACAIEMIVLGYKCWSFIGTFFCEPCSTLTLNCFCFSMMSAKHSFPIFDFFYNKNPSKDNKYSSWHLF